MSDATTNYELKRLSSGHWHLRWPLGRMPKRPDDGFGWLEEAHWRCAEEIVMKDKAGT